LWHNQEAVNPPGKSLSQKDFLGGEDQSKALISKGLRAQHLLTFKLNVGPIQSPDLKGIIEVAIFNQNV
jgi:hypothetical protein